MILNRTILLVEDSEPDRLLFSRYIKQSGYNCVCMENADDLLTRIDDIEPSIILMDIEMPGINGLKAAAILRERQKTNGKCHFIIALTAHNDIDVLGAVKAAGFDDYLQKPVTRQELSTRLAHYFDRDNEICIGLGHETPENTQMNKLYSLEMFDADDPDFVRSIVEMFVANTPESISAIRKAYEQDEMETLRQQAHKIKPHFSFFGAPGIQQALQTIENIARANENKEQLPDLIDCAEKTSIKMIAQMKADLLS